MSCCIEPSPTCHAIICNENERLEFLLKKLGMMDGLNGARVGDGGWYWWWWKPDIAFQTSMTTTSTTTCPPLKIESTHWSVRSVTSWSINAQSKRLFSVNESQKPFPTQKKTFLFEFYCFSIWCGGVELNSVESHLCAGSFIDVCISSGRRSVISVCFDC